MSAREETPMERYERLAAEFYRETGMMAPGKDDPLGHHDWDRRWEAWNAWLVHARATPAGGTEP